MNYKIPIETSARHIHVSQKDFEQLFGEGASLTFVKELSQPGQYLCAERLTVRGPKGDFENVAILGPFRKDTQVELSVTDCRKLGIPSVIRQSGDIAFTPGCTLIGPDGKELTIDKGVIVAKRHIHMTPQEAMAMHVKDNQEVFVITKSYERALIYADVVVRVDKNFRLSMHVDTDEANAFSSDAEPYGVIIKLFDESYNIHMWMDELLSGIVR
ncbi:MAG TPA: phosphate propanoyltransferase [Candidatus Blautia gallistercoris]|uniref:Phosphate propanoyltransferase n=1 Tax=Candidatus Blautia gallistercoris TaxID=2838490 RepID=A0A9D2B3V5_9FIRM|nr:phosphate propanoyltransferase [Candidatus Blautia gallistercoris]